MHVLREGKQDMSGWGETLAFRKIRVEETRDIWKAAQDSMGFALEETYSGACVVYPDWDETGSDPYWNVWVKTYTEHRL